MKELPLRARLYILAVVIPAVGVFVWSLSSLPTNQEEWLLFAVLTVAAAAAQLFPVVTPRNQSYELTPIVVFAALLVLKPGALALLIVIAFVPQWIRERKVWYIQIFNIAIYLLQAFLARGFYLWATATYKDSASSVTVGLPEVAAAVAAAAIFTVANHFLLAVVLRLARRRTWKETRLFEFEYFIIDTALSCSGALIAFLLPTAPWLIALIAAPLFLIYRGLNTANLLEQARTDPKTGLFNARYFYRVMREELRRSERFGRPVAVVMADMDLLRNINNTYGHLAGDEVLKGVADILRSGLRDYDVAARFGGEEFVVLLPEDDREQAIAVAERIRKQVEETRFVVPTSAEPIRTTLSLGVAAFPMDGATVNEVIHQADLAVYYSKLQGRNRVWASSPESRALGPEIVAYHDLDYAPWEASSFPVSQLGREATATITIGAAANATQAVDRANLSALATELGSGVTSTASDLAPAPGLPSPGAATLAPEKMVSQSARFVPFLIAAVALFALALWAVYRPWSASLDWVGIAVLAALTIGAQSLFIETYGRGKISTSAIPLLAGGFLFGVPAALILAPLVPVTNWIRTRGRLHRAIFDAGDTSIAAATASAAYQFTSAFVRSQEPVFLLFPAAVAAFAYYIVNVGLISIAIGLEEGRSPIDAWNEKFRWLSLHYLSFGLLALLMAMAYQAIWIYGLASFFVPPVMLRFVMKQYVDRTEANVAEVKRVNDELRSAHGQVLRTLDELRVTYDSTLLALSTALDSRDTNTEGHSQRVTGYVLSIAREVGLPDTKLPPLLNGALLHDVGKIGVPDAILNKDGSLTPEEWSIMRTHPEIGYRMLEHISFLKDAIPVVRHHHERFDGRGYPDGLKGDEIPISARIFAVADAFDAMISDRPYRAALSMERARAEIERGAGGQFDPMIVQAFLRIPDSELANPPSYSLNHPQALPAAGNRRRSS